MKKTIGIVGLGLIGGSLALSLKHHTDCSVLGADRSEETLRQAISAGAADGVLEDVTVPDLILLAVYPDGVLQWLRKFGPVLRPEQTVVDCCGIKTEICRLGYALGRRYGFSFVGGHPMAGREVAGFSAASDKLFRGATMLLLPEKADDPAAEKLRPLFLAMGFGAVQYTDPDFHDRMIAYTSQLAHLLSNAYVKSPAALSCRGFTGGSFQDLTRVAYLNEHLWCRLFMENRGPLLSELDRLIDNLSAYRSALEEKDETKLTGLLREGREMKEACGVGDRG